MSLTHQLYLQRIREVESFDAKAFDSFREPVIARLLDHAWRTVPYCRDRLAPFVQAGDFDMADWFSIPLLQPDDIARNPGPMAAQDLPKFAAEVEEVAHNAFVNPKRRSRLSRIAAECERERFYEKCDVDLSGILALVEPDEARAEAQGSGWSITFDLGKWVAPPTFEATELRSWLIATGARQMRTTHRIAEELARSGAVAGIGIVILVGDSVSGVSRRRLGQALNARIAHWVERPVIGQCAADCGAEEGYLVPAASNIVEVVDRFGQPARPGEMGQLVVTPLYEYACPLLRLATGIVAIPPDDPATSLGVRSLADVCGPINA